MDNLMFVIALFLVIGGLAALFVTQVAKPAIFTNKPASDEPPTITPPVGEYSAQVDSWLKGQMDEGVRKTTETPDDLPRGFLTREQFMDSLASTQEPMWIILQRQRQEAVDKAVKEALKKANEDGVTSYSLGLCYENALRTIEHYRQDVVRLGQDVVRLQEDLRLAHEPGSPHEIHALRAQCARLQKDYEDAVGRERNANRAFCELVDSARRVRNGEQDTFYLSGSAWALKSRLDVVEREFNAKRDQFEQERKIREATEKGVKRMREDEKRLNDVIDVLKRMLQNRGMTEQNIRLAVQECLDIPALANDPWIPRWIKDQAKRQNHGVDMTPQALVRDQMAKAAARVEGAHMAEMLKAVAPNTPSNESIFSSHTPPFFNVAMATCRECGRVLPNEHFKGGVCLDCQH